MVNTSSSGEKSKSTSRHGSPADFRVFKLFIEFDWSGLGSIGIDDSDGLSLSVENRVVFLHESNTHLPIEFIWSRASESVFSVVNFVWREVQQVSVVRHVVFEVVVSGEQKILSWSAEDPWRLFFQEHFDVQVGKTVVVETDSWGANVLSFGIIGSSTMELMSVLQVVQDLLEIHSWHKGAVAICIESKTVSKLAKLLSSELTISHVSSPNVLIWRSYSVEWSLTS